MEELDISKVIPLPKYFELKCSYYFDEIIFKKESELIYTVANNKKKIERSQRIVQLRVNSNLHNLTKRIYFTIPLIRKHKIEIQTWEVARVINNQLKEEFYSTLFDITILENDSTKKFKLGSENRYISGTNPINGMGYYKQHYIVNFDSLMKRGPLKEVLNILDENQLSRISLVPGNSQKLLLMIYRRRKDLMFMHRKKMKLLMRDVIESKVNYAILTRNRVNLYQQFISEHDLNFNEFRVFMNLLQNGVRIRNINFDALDVFKPDDDLSELKDRGIVRTMNYLYKNKSDYGYYQDYLSIMDDIGTPATEPIEFFPRDLRISHDNVVAVLNLMKREIDAKNLEPITENLVKLEYSNEKYCVIAPKSLDDIVFEGKELQHCVGGNTYLNNHKSGRYAIMFIRKVNKQTTPFITCTYHYDNTISQIHPFKNKDKECAEFEEVKEFSKEWLEWLEERNKNDKQIYISRENHQRSNP